MNNWTKGVLLIILSAFGFSMMNLLIPLVEGLSSIEKSFFRNVVTLILAGIFFLRSPGRKIFLSEKPDQKFPWLLLLLRSALGTFGVICNFYAVDHLLIADASVLQKIAPFATIVFSSIFLKEFFTKYHLIALFISFLGILFVVKPSMASTDYFPYIVGITGGLSAGGAYTCMRHLNQRGVNGSFIVLFFSLFSCAFTFPAVVVNYQPISMRNAILLLGIGLTAGIGQYGMTYAYKYAPASEISIFDYLAVVFTGLLGYFVLGQVPDQWSIVGYCFILIAIMITFFYNRYLFQIAKRQLEEAEFDQFLTKSPPQDKRIKQ